MKLVTEFVGKVVSIGTEELEVELANGKKVLVRVSCKDVASFEKGDTINWIDINTGSYVKQFVRRVD